MSSDTAQMELANQFASFNPEELRKHFDDLNNAIRMKAEPITQHLRTLKNGLDELLPYLAEMQSLLSQRGKARKMLCEAKLPTWTKWFKSFDKDTGLNVTLRAVQKQLAKLRGAKNQKEPDPPVKLSPKNQKRLLTVHQYANEIVAAVENNADCSEVVPEASPARLPNLPQCWVVDPPQIDPASHQGTGSGLNAWRSGLR